MAPEIACKIGSAIGAKINAREQGLDADVRVADAEHLPFDDGQFDIVYSWGVLHHTPVPARALSEAERVLGELTGMTNDARAAIPVMAPGRGDVIVAGAVILVEVMRRFGYERTLVSETDILDGLAFEALGVR